jgi:ribulose-phosphate 3-epimerase
MNREQTLKQLLAAKPLIAPSMLKCDFGDLGEDIRKLEAAGAPVLHMDVMDGHFVPNISYGAMVIERMREHTKLPFDAHLMISDPEKYLNDFIKAGCDGISIHLEAVAKPIPLLEKIREAGALSGLVINPPTPVEMLEPFLPHCDLILIMSVNPGFGGQKFIPEALPKLKWVKERLRDDQLLSVDGGIAMGTIAATAQAGANHFVCGSSIFDQPDYFDAITKLRTAATV